MGYKKCKMFTTTGAGSFTVPTGVTEIMVEAWVQAVVALSIVAVQVAAMPEQFKP